MKILTTNFRIKNIYMGIFFLLFSLTIFTVPAYAASFLVEHQSVNYQIEGGIVKDMVIDSDFIELIVYIDSTEDGLLQISFPRILLDAKFNDSDDIFFVIVDGFQTEYVEINSDMKSRTIIIPFFSGDTQIEIIGTTVMESSLQEFISEPEIEIPPWIKNNAGWWADDLIGDSDFVSGIQFLISEGIMSV
ncbi:MAG TPA: hypothetical protein VD731_03675 [Nitrosopumilaceae archaeon]|nr:hypothetical protein [Nitrosopumilaceae archaeon]